MPQQLNNVFRAPADRLIVSAALAILMVATRLGHFGEFSGPPDASWAVFFLGGLWLRSGLMFSGFFALAFATDLAAVALGTPTDCFSPAYAFLIPAYGALWFAGSLTDRFASAPFAVVAAAATTFGLANLGMYWFANVSGVDAGVYAAAVVRYFPHYLIVMSVYVTVALLASAVLHSRLLESARRQ